MNYLKSYFGEGKPYSYEQLGEAFGVTRQQVGNLLSSPIREWRIYRLQTVADMLGVDVHVLFAKALSYETRKRKKKHDTPA